jgi:hypothetical protein
MNGSVIKKGRCSLGTPEARADLHELALAASVCSRVRLPLPRNTSDRSIIWNLGKLQVFPADTAPSCHQREMGAGVYDALLGLRNSNE